MKFHTGAINVSPDILGERIASEFDIYSMEEFFQAFGEYYKYTWMGEETTDIVALLRVTADTLEENNG